MRSRRLPPAARSSVWLYGIHAVAGALQGRKRAHHRLHLKRDWQRSPRLVELAEQATEQEIPLRSEVTTVLEERCGERAHQGVVLESSALPTVDAHRLLQAESATSAPSLLVALDHLEDAQNLGAVMRTAALFGAAGVICTARGAAPPNALAAKAAAGYLDLVPLARVVNLARFLQYAGQHGFWTIAADPQASKALADFDPPRKQVLVLGNEGEGLRPLVKKRCDVLLRIAHAAPRFSAAVSASAAPSLNVAAAAAIALHHLSRPEAQAERQEEPGQAEEIIRSTRPKPEQEAR